MLLFDHPRRWIIPNNSTLECEKFGELQATLGKLRCWPWLYTHDGCIEPQSWPHAVSGFIVSWWKKSAQIESPHESPIDLRMSTLLMLSKAPRSVWYSNHRRVFTTSSKCNYSSALPRLIQQHDLWITQEGTADGHTLLLSTRQSTTTRSDTRLQTLVAIPKFWDWNSQYTKMGVPQNGWFIMENPIKMDDLVVPPFLETPKCTSPDCLFQKKTIEVFLSFSRFSKCHPTPLGLPRYPGNYTYYVVNHGVSPPNSQWGQ